MLLSNLCDYSNANIVAKWTIDLRAAANKNDKDGKDVVFKNSAPFTNAHQKTNSTFTDKAEDLDMVMSMYYFVECSGNYSMTTVSL